MENLNSLLSESLQLLFIGMSSVFIILTLLIFLITLVTKLLPKESIEAAKSASRSSSPSVQNKSNNNEVIAAISVAVNAFRKRNSD